VEADFHGSCMRASLLACINPFVIKSKSWRSFTFPNAHQDAGSRGVADLGEALHLQKQATKVDLFDSTERNSLWSRSSMRMQTLAWRILCEMVVRSCGLPTMSCSKCKCLSPIPRSRCGPPANTRESPSWSHHVTLLGFFNRD
jgi:hypothetical protein